MGIQAGHPRSLAHCQAVQTPRAPSQELHCKRYVLNRSYLGHEGDFDTVELNVCFNNFDDA